MVEGASTEPQKRSWLRHGPADLPDDGKPLPYGTRLAHHLRTRHFFGSILVLVVIAIVLVCCRVDLQWYWLIIYAGDTPHLPPGVISRLLIAISLPLKQCCLQCIWYSLS